LGAPIQLSGTAGAETWATRAGNSVGPILARPWNIIFFSKQLRSGVGVQAQAAVSRSQDLLSADCRTCAPDLPDQHGRGASTGFGPNSKPSLISNGRLLFCNFGVQAELHLPGCKDGSGRSVQSRYGAASDRENPPLQSGGVSSYAYNLVAM